MKPRPFTKKQVEAEPFRIWNAYVNLLAMEHYENLSSVQRPAHLVFWYESEVQNGGHFQYFENRGADQLSATIDALGSLGATCQQQVLREAGELWLSRTRPRIQTPQEFCDTALEGEFNVFDSRFHACSPTLQACLEAYLSRHRSSFIKNCVNKTRSEGGAPPRVRGRKNEVYKMMPKSHQPRPEGRSAVFPTRSARRGGVLG